MNTAEVRNFDTELKLLLSEYQADIHRQLIAKGMAGTLRQLTHHNRSANVAAVALARQLHWDDLDLILGDIERVSAARQRLMKHQFGLCRCCGDEIELNQLRADPTIDICMTCHSASQRQKA